MQAVVQLDQGMLGGLSRAARFAPPSRRQPSFCAPLPIRGQVARQKYMLEKVISSGRTETAKFEGFHVQATFTSLGCAASKRRDLQVTASIMFFLKYAGALEPFEKWRRGEYKPLPLLDRLITQRPEPPPVLAVLD